MAAGTRARDVTVRMPPCVQRVCFGGTASMR